MSASRSLTVLLAVLLSVSVLVEVCATRPQPAHEEGLLLVATIPPLQSILQRLVGDRAQVYVLVNAGATPHSYALRPSDMIALEHADAVFYMDSALDGWLLKGFAESAQAVLPLLPASNFLAYEENADGINDDHEHSGHDPHIWMDPLLIRELVPVLAIQLAAIDPAGHLLYQANAELFQQELSQLHEEINTLLQPVQGRAVLQQHQSMQYMLHRYGLLNAGTIESAPGRAPTPRQRQALAETIETFHVRAVLVEPQLSRRMATVLAHECNVPIVQVDPLGGIEGRQHYTDLLRWNAMQLAGALHD